MTQAAEFPKFDRAGATIATSPANASVGWSVFVSLWAMSLCLFGSACSNSNLATLSLSPSASFHARTFSTSPSASRLDGGVGGVIWMALRTLSPLTQVLTSIASEAIFAVSHGLQMIWVYATANPARVVDVDISIVRDGAFEQHVSRSLSRFNSTVHPKIAVSIGEYPHPDPATRLRYWHHVLHETLHDGLGFPWHRNSVSQLRNTGASL